MIYFFKFKIFGAWGYFSSSTLFSFEKNLAGQVASGQVPPYNLRSSSAATNEQQNGQVRSLPEHILVHVYRQVRRACFRAVPSAARSRVSSRVSRYTGRAIHYDWYS